MKVRGACAHARTFDFFGGQAMASGELLFFWQRWVLQSLMGPLADLRDLVDVELSDLVDITIQTGTARETGNPAIERKIYSEVARAGKQLGCITDAVVELAQRTGNTDEKHVKRLMKLRDDIEKVKRKAAKARAKESLDQLKKIDPDTFRELIKEMVEQRSKTAKSDPTPVSDTSP
jgi:hypothetical protein